MIGEGIDASIDFDPEAQGAVRVVLIGFMGAGKTTLARRWAESGGPTMWFDSDQAALHHLNAKTVEEVIRKPGGWERFRTAEAEVIKQRAKPVTHGVEVWSLGGGALENHATREHIKDACVVWLDAPKELLWQRVAGSDRPLARDFDAFCDLYTARQSTYAELATVRVDASVGLDDLGLGRILAEHLPPSWFGSGLIVGANLSERIEDLSALSKRQVAIVADSAVDFLADQVRNRLERAGVNVASSTHLPMGEWNKQLATVETLVRAWAEDGIHRYSTVIAIGGGTLLDAAGFAASIYQRGINWVCVPTTLTSQVDAGIGGKTGVNLGVTKNVIGTVHMPQATVIDPLLLDSLPGSALREGFVEAVKTAMLAGEWLLERVEKIVYGSDARNSAEADQQWLNLIAGCSSYKDAVVADDPFDTDGVRAQLNLGHTVAHAIEAATGGAVSHGAAVAIGTHLALRLSELVLDADTEIAERWCGICTEMGIVTTSPLAWDELTPFLKQDKKRDEEGIAWILMNAVGEPVSRVRLPLEAAQLTWDKYVYMPPSSPTALIETANDLQPRVLVLFGANLNQLGARDPEHYGAQTLASLVKDIEAWAAEYGLIADCRQTDSLERFLSAIHEARTRHQAVLVNPGAWTHHELSLHDALEPLEIPRVEIHLSDINQREEWRQKSVIRDVVDRSIIGLGRDGYRDALRWIKEQLR